MSSIRRWAAVAAGLVLALALGACGGGGSSTGPTTLPPTPAPTPTPPVVLGQGGGPLEVDFLARVPFTTTQPGTIEITVDWTFATNDLDVVLVRGDCSFDAFVAEQCAPIAASFSTTAKPEKVRLPGAAAGAYTFFVGNSGPGDESASYQIVLMPGASSAATSRSSERVPEKFRNHRRGPDFQ